jgi:hypothetical protein
MKSHVRKTKSATGLLSGFVFEIDLAKELRLERRALCRNFGQHGPKRIRIGKKCILYSRAQVLAWLEKQKQVAR